jgi:hypothetical protein
MIMKRPFGVTLIAILAIISGLFGLCLPFLAFTDSLLFGGILGTVGAVAGVFLVIGPLLQFIFAYGALKLRSWAWYLGLIATGVTVIGVIINLINGASFFSAVWGSALAIIIFIYLWTPTVRKAFGIISETPEAIEPIPTVEPPASPEIPEAPETPVVPEEPEPAESPGSGDEAG